MKNPKPNKGFNQYIKSKKLSKKSSKASNSNNKITKYYEIGDTIKQKIGNYKLDHVIMVLDSPKSIRDAIQFVRSH
jgi:hypothetical protein